MKYVLENDKLRVEINSFGAEITSVIDKATNREYMWQPTTWWGRTSPILFPFVGRLKNDEFLHNGQTYNMRQHGFAKDIEHCLVSKTEDTIWFKLVTSNETLSQFPFSFILRIGYELKDNEVKVLWEVSNNSVDKHMHFGIGGHPAFHCPIDKDTQGNYQLYFAGLDELHHHGINNETGLSIDEDIVLPLENNRAIITPDFFDGGTYICENKQTTEIGLEDPNGNRLVTVLFDMPLFGLWAPDDKDAQLICIEPWCGRCDAEDFEGTLKARPYDNVLQAGEKFNQSYVMRFGM